MELAGEEKKLQALFSELKRTEEQIAPRFATVWNRAQLSPRRVRALTPAFVAATALLVFGLISLAVWLRYSKPSQPQTIQAGVVAPTRIESPRVAVAATSPAPKIIAPVKHRNINRGLVARALLARRDAQFLAANQKVTQDAKTIDNWQSPTTALMSSPNNEIFTSLPQFNQSASDLKSFLPSRTN